ncbi:hypothetical protein R20233_01728 [Ralstonia sp. LMG 32965]|uniref:DUF4124 domain-containing protein n=1 Tax=Ralstonia flatus TaxID=3058601 RepID=UPI0028F6022A|nr:DUF4124 domain-containing protein [Ralstonia sp. LMG 32965]CAJ0870921.1 hypothetical protein R20233_01728 [Ralstonia sp. LMG 32965]
MTPIAILTSRAAVLAGLALGLAALSLGAHAQVYRCSENGQTTYSDHPCGTRAKPVPMIDNTPTAADQKAARERATAEAAEVQQMETARRKAQAAEDARQAQIAAQAAEQARREQRQKVVVAQEGIRYCHRVYVGPVPYPQPYPTPMPVISQPPAPAAGALRQSGNGTKPFTQAPAVPTPIVPRPPRPHYPHYRIVCEPGYAYEGPEDLLPIQ